MITTRENDASAAILLLAHGTPAVLGEMKSYLELVTGGRDTEKQAESRVESFAPEELSVLPA